MAQPRRVLTAAAQRYTAQLAASRAIPADGSWQPAAINAYRTVPEIRFVARWIGSAMSQATLFAGRPGPDNSIAPLPDDHPASEIVAQIAGGVSGQPDFLGAFGPHLTVTGEAWTLVSPVIDAVTGQPSSYEWRVLSTQEVRPERGRLTVQKDGVEVVIPAYDEDDPDDTNPVAFRVWEPDPFMHRDADSAIKSSLGLIEELNLLSLAIQAIARSRITGRGILLVPKGTRFPTQQGTVGDAEDDLLDVFMEVASTAIREPGSAAATVPIVLEVPADVIGEVRHLTLDSEFDTMAQQLRGELRERIAIGMDVPKEIITGLSDASHWNVWSIKGDAIQTAVEPKLATVCHALTTAWLRPALDARRVPDADDVLVWYDTASLRTATNKAAIALEAYQAGLISGQAARRETGFTEADAPGAGTAPVEPAAGRPALPVAETEAMPAEPSASALPGPDAALCAALDVAVNSALTRVGERMLNRPVCPRAEREAAQSVPAAQRYRVYRVNEREVEAWGLLEGAWSGVPEVAVRSGAAPGALTAALDRYVIALLTTQTPHTYDNVVTLVRQAGAGR